LDPEQRNDYEKLKQDNSMLQNEIQDSRGQLEEVSQRLMKAEGLLKQDTLKQRAQHLREEKAQLTKRKDNLEMQTNELNLPFPEARERLMNRIKSENGEIKQLDKELTEARKMIDTYNRNIKEIEGDLKDKKDGDDMQKYEILYQKEKQINDFMTSFEEEKAEYEVDISKKQKIIQGLLNHMSNNIKRQGALPSQSEVSDMKKDLNFKTRQLNDAENTAAKL
jgi:intraflagellar transport protein 74